MSFTRTVVSRRDNFNFDPETPTGYSSKAVFGTADLGTLLGIVKSGGFKENSSKVVLTNNSVPDTITYTALGKEMTYEVALKSGAQVPYVGQLLRLPAPSGTGLAELLMVVDNFESKYEEEGYRMGTLTGTFHAGLMDAPNAAVSNDPAELMSVKFVNGAVAGTQVAPAVATGIEGN